MEDLSMAVYLPVMGALLAGGLAVSGLLGAGLAIVAVILLLMLALRFELGVSRVLFSRNDEALLLTILGFALLLAGLAESLNVSAAVGALLAGILLSGPAERGARVLLSPLRDLFAAIFFFFIGLAVDPATIPPVLATAAILALVGAGTKFLTGWWAGARAGLNRASSARAGATLIPRGEVSLAIAALGTSADVGVPLAALSVAYVLVLSVFAPVAIRVAGREPAPA
jgi:CPA2 family monovalent cation:H+ antiporter-2